MSYLKIFVFTGLHKLYSLEFLDLADNSVASPDEIRALGALPCLDHLILRGNPIREVIEYRIKVLEHFGERAAEVVCVIRTSTLKKCFMHILTLSLVFCYEIIIGL